MRVKKEEVSSKERKAVAEQGKINSLNACGTSALRLKYSF